MNFTGRDSFFGLNQTVSSHGTHSVASFVAGNHITQIENDKVHDPIFTAIELNIDVEGRRATFKVCLGDFFQDYFIVMGQSRNPTGAGFGRS
jgi:hypothetical protein